MAETFIKWAGSKRQLIPTLDSRLPDDFKKNIKKYVEPFIGGGSYYFHIIENYKNIKKAFLNDINPKLTNCYKMIKNHPDVLNTKMKRLNDMYNTIDNEEDKKEIFNIIKHSFNRNEGNDAEMASYFIFLNKTCFNGLYRVNSKGEFNVPYGKNPHPNLYNELRINTCHKLLKKAKITDGDFAKLVDEADENTFFYLDPPYRPISKTSSFTSYYNVPFDDKEQIRLKEFCDAIDDKGAYFLMSNSDCEDGFFDELYKEYFIEKIKARRNINSRGEARGYISEILVTNYQN